MLLLSIFFFFFYALCIVRYACKLVQLALNYVFVFNFPSITPEFGEMAADFDDPCGLSAVSSSWDSYTPTVYVVQML